MKRLKIFTVFILVLGVLMVFIVRFCNAVVEESSKEYLVLKEKRRVALVLGTSQHLVNGRVNLYFKYRVQKAAELYKNGYIQYIVVSGDNGRKGYNEPRDMKEALMRLGVPEDKIFCDYAGFNTLDSVLRMKFIFSQTNFVIVSQNFHLKRAVYLARRNGMKVVGVAAKNPPAGYSKTIHVREQLARVKAVFEVVMGLGPAYYGKAIAIK